VKALFKAKFGELVNEDNVNWNFSGGAAPSTEQFESRFPEVKALLEAKFGEDAYEHVDEDSIGLTSSPRAAASAEQLESRLPDVKALFEAKFGELVDESSWNFSGGAAPSTEQLESRLLDTKALFKAKCSEDVDEDVPHVSGILFCKAVKQLYSSLSESRSIGCLSNIDRRYEVSRRGIIRYV